MLTLICLVCLLGCFGGILLGISLKGLLVVKLGLEAAQKKMFLIGTVSILLALALSFSGFITGNS